jgi:hypothetical protein
MWIGVLGIVLLVVAIGLEISKFGDRSPTAVITRNERTDAVVVFLCDDTRPIADCRGRLQPARTTTYDPVREVGHDEDEFGGEVIVTTDGCEVVSRTRHQVSGDVAVVIGQDGTTVRTDISPYSERYAPGFEVLGSPAKDVRCPLEVP